MEFKLKSISPEGVETLPRMPFSSTLMNNGNTSAPACLLTRITRPCARLASSAPNASSTLSTEISGASVVNSLALASAYSAIEA